MPKKRETATFALLAHPHFAVKVSLWESREAMQAFAKARGHGVAGNGDTRAYCRGKAVRSATRLPTENRPFDLHFVKGDWSLEVVVHECCHGFRHLEWIAFSPFKVGDIPMDLEEPLCYSIGKLADDVYRWLWSLDPNDRWVRNEEGDKPE